MESFDGGSSGSPGKLLPPHQPSQFPPTIVDLALFLEDTTYGVQGEMGDFKDAPERGTLADE